MNDKVAGGAHRSEKACVCRLFPRSKIFLRPTHQHDAEGQAKYKCWLSGRVVYESV
jgi:hypothetical protein